MSKRKGLSADEKKTRMLQIFYEKKDFFQLKELEKIAPKEKGITMQSVKEVVQALVDDNLVDSEKIGTSIYFWAFPSKAQHIKKRKLEELRTQHEEGERKLKKTTETIAAEKTDREEGEERDKLIQELSQARTAEEKLKTELKKYRHSDPEYIEHIRREIKESRDAVNRWTGNIFILKSYCKNNFFMEESVLNESFDIPADLDYFEA